MNKVQATNQITAALGVVLLLLLTPGAALGFKPEVADAMQRIGKAWEAFGQVDNVPTTITWLDGQSLVYQTRVGGQEAFRELTLTNAATRAISREQFQQHAEHREPEQHPIHPPGFIYSSGAGPVASPDGQWTAFIRHDNVWVRSDATGEIQLSHNGSPTNRYQELMWSPDSAKLAALRRETQPERQITLIESHPRGTVHPRTKRIPYAKPGDPRNQSEPALFLPAERRQIPLANYDDFAHQFDLYLGCWLPDSSAFTFYYNQRGHQVYRLSAVDATSGQVRTVAEERFSTFVHWTDQRLWWLAGGRQLLWTSERDGWRHLYLVDTASGAARQLDHGEWNAREAVRIDETQGIVYLMANGFAAATGEDPYNQHLLRLELATGRTTDLTPANGNHQVRLSPDLAYFSDVWSRPDAPPQAVVSSARDGAIVANFPSVNAASALDSQRVPTAEVFAAKGRDGLTDIWGTIWRPIGFDATRRYPVVEFIYAGPQGSDVPKDFATGCPYGAQLLAAGFVVVTIDGMGTDNRSRAFQEVCYKNLRDAGFPDRIPWIKAAAATRPWMDTSRVGIFGYSAGGQNALGALLFHGDFYRAAVALCGCHDNRVDKLWWNEQWMGYPVDATYAANSNVENAHLLQGKLLLVNGELDDNVDPASTLQVVDALVKAGKDFEQLYLPGRTHNLGGDYVDRRVLDFFLRNL